MKRREMKRWTLGRRRGTMRRIMTLKFSSLRIVRMSQFAPKDRIGTPTSSDQR
jgi:hypothetical protein